MTNHVRNSSSMKLSLNATKTDSSNKNKSIDGQLTDRARIARQQAAKDSLSACINRAVPVINQLKGLRHMSSNLEEQNALAVELVEWSCQPDSYYIEKFPVSKGISPYRFFKVKHTNDLFAECVELSNAICHLNLKQAVHTGELHHSYVLSLLPIIDGDYKGYMMEKIAKKVTEYIKSQQKFECTWLADMKKEVIANESQSGSHTNQPVQTQTIPEGLP